MEYALPDSITNIRGYVFPEAVCGVPTLVGVHPAFILRNWHPWWATFCWDWQKAARVVAQGAFVPHKVEVEVLTSTEALGNWWGGVVAQARRTNDAVIACDVETIGCGCIGFAASPYQAVIVPGKPASNHKHVEVLTAILNNTNGIEFVLQNGQFDWMMFARAGMVPERAWPQFTHDLMLEWHALDPLIAGARQDAANKTKGRTEKSLEFFAGLLLDGAQRWKNYSYQNDMEQFTLCGIDNGYTLACWRELRRRLATT